ncbi:MAG: hypothetical protein CR988_07775 [Treponema sp.]|nr:MAG: hypothetical protein CR988_07775 [Treponema sp.]
MQEKVLSVKNPFSYLIIYGGKDVENRTWKTDYRGRLYIHSSGRPMLFFPDEIYDMAENLQEDKKQKKYFEKLDDVLINLRDKYVQIGKDNNLEGDELFKFLKKNAVDFSIFSYQSIIGYVDLVDIVQDSLSPWAIDGQYHWILENPTPLKEPINQVKGRLGLWNYNLPE